VHIALNQGASHAIQFSKTENKRRIAGYPGKSHDTVRYYVLSRQPLCWPGICDVAVPDLLIGTVVAGSGCYGGSMAHIVPNSIRLTILTHVKAGGQVG